MERVSGAAYTHRYIDSRQTDKQKLTVDVRVSAASAAETLRRNAARLTGWMGSEGGGGAEGGGIYEIERSLLG